MKKILLAAWLMAGLSSQSVAQVGPVAPPVTADLRLNLDAFVGYSSIFGGGYQWQDQSGNGNHVSSFGSSTSPLWMSTLGSFTGLIFDGVDDVMSRPANTTNGFTNPNATIFIVRIANTRYMTSTWNTMLAIGENNTFNNDFSMLRDWAAHSTSSGNWVRRDHTCFINLPDCRPAIVTGVMRTGIGAGDLDYYVNGVISTNAPVTQGSPAPFTAASRGIAIGGTWGSVSGGFAAGAYFKGTILKVLAYDRALTTAEIAQVHQYLRTRYDILYACGTTACDPDFSWTMSTRSPNYYTFRAQQQNLPYNYDWEVDGTIVNSGPNCTLYFPNSAPKSYKVCLLLRDCKGQEVCRQCIDFCHGDMLDRDSIGCTPHFTITSTTNAPMDVALAPDPPGGSYIWTAYIGGASVYAGPSTALPFYNVTVSSSGGAPYNFEMADPANPSCFRRSGANCFYNNSPSPYKIAPLQDDSPLELVSVAPNPASTLVTVQLSRTTAEPLQLRVSDMSGRTVYTGTSTGTNKIDIPLQGFATGMYIVQLQGKTVLLNAKFVKQ